MRFRLNRLTLPQQLLIVSFIVLAAALWSTRNFGTPWQSISGLAYSPDGRRLAIDIFSGRFRRTRGRWYFADISHSVALASVTEDRSPTILGRDRQPGNLNMLPEVCIGQSVAFSPDGSVLASAGAEGQFKLWDVATGRRKVDRTSQRDHLRTIVPLSGQPMLLGAFRYWLSFLDLDPAAPSLTVRETGTSVQTVAVSPDGSQFAIAGLGPFRVEIWDARAKKKRQTIVGDNETFDRVTALAYSADSKTLLAAAEGTIKFLDAKTGQITDLIPERLILSLDVSPDGRYFATGRFDGVTLWDAATRKKTSLRFDAPTVESLRFSPDGRLLATGSIDGFVRIWDVETGALRQAWSFPKPISVQALRWTRMGLIGAWIAAFAIYARRFVDLRKWLRPIGLHWIGAGSRR